jgi:transcriptional regulator with XRE-family HTH domain
MSVQIIEKSGKPEYAVIPYAEYQALLEMAREDESIPAAVSERLVLGDEHPLKVWREYRGYTQESLGAKAGIGKSYVSQIEAGTKTGSTKVLRALAKALQIAGESWDVWFDGDGTSEDFMASRELFPTDIPIDSQCFLPYRTPTVNFFYGDLRLYTPCLQLMHIR